MEGYDSPTTIMSLSVNGQISCDKLMILEEIASYFQSTFSSTNYIADFQNYKNNYVSNLQISESQQNLEIYNPLTINKL